MFKYEVELWYKFQDNLKFIIRQLYVMCNKPDYTIQHWKLLASMTALGIAHSTDYYELVESGSTNNGILDSVWYADYGDDYKVIDTFFTDKSVMIWWENTFSVECPKFNMSEALEHPTMKRTVNLEIFLKIRKAALEQKLDLWLGILLYAHMLGYNREQIGILRHNPYRYGYRVSDLLKDMSILSEPYEHLEFGGSTVDSTLSKWNNELKSHLDKCDDFFVLGKDTSTLAQIEQYYESNDNGVAGMRNALSAASVIEASNISGPDSYLYDAAVEYLRGVDYIGEDEIEGIITSHFMTLGAEKGYDTIKSVY